MDLLKKDMFMSACDDCGDDACSGCGDDSETCTDCGKPMDDCECEVDIDGDE